MNLIDVGHDGMWKFKNEKLKELFYVLQSIYNGKGADDHTVYTVPERRKR